MSSPVQRLLLADESCGKPPAKPHRASALMALGWSRPAYTCFDDASPVASLVWLGTRACWCVPVTEVPFLGSTHRGRAGSVRTFPSEQPLPRVASTQRGAGYEFLASLTAVLTARKHGLTVAEIEDWRDRFLLAAENPFRAWPKTTRR